uniref:SGNH domain-containing protein n=1 Tax=Macrostomum lignano TaxID=282301 RepID=A0A1I8F5C6_9PLAT
DLLAIDNVSEGNKLYYFHKEGKALTCFESRPEFLPNYRQQVEKHDKICPARRWHPACVARSTTVHLEAIKSPTNSEPACKAVAEEGGFPLDRLPWPTANSSIRYHMESLRSLLQEIRFDDNTAPRVLVNEPLAGESASYLSWLNSANIRSTFVFIYVTNEFCGTPSELRYIEELYNESVSDQLIAQSHCARVRSSGVDVHSIEEMSIPEAALFRNLRGMRLEMDPMTRCASCCAPRLNQRRSRENVQIEQVRDEIARANNREGARLIDQLASFFAERMRLSEEDVKRLRDPLDAVLQHHGEPLPSTEAADRSAGRREQSIQQPRQQPLLQPQAAAAAAQQVVNNPENVQVGSANQLSVRGQTVHVHVTYVQQFVAGAYRGHQHAQGGEDAEGAQGGG